MAWGIFNKIKKGFKKIGSVFKKGANLINDKVIKPFKPIIKTAANTFLPGSSAVVDLVSDGIDAVSNGDWGGAKQAAGDVSSWAKGRFG